MRKLLLGLIGLLFAIPAVADLDPCRNLVNINASNIDIGHYISTSGAYTASSANFLYIPYVPVNPDTTYTLTWGGDELYFITISEYSTNNDSGFIRRNQGTTTGNTSLTITTGENTHYIRFGSNPYGNNNEVTFEQVAALRWQLEQGNATEYVPYCANQIRIATTAYNSARFSPVVTELNDTIATIRDVVTNTINQTKAIADLQATKQTRPNENCPAGKKCLLVEDDAGMPHWYEIIENAYGLPSGYTELEYIQTDGNSWVDTGYIPNGKPTIKTKLYTPALTSQLWGCRWTPAPTYDTLGAIVGSGGNLTIYYGLYEDSKYTVFSNYRTGVIHTFELGENFIIYDGSTTNISRENISSTYSFTVGGFNNNGEINQTGVSRIYSMEVKESGNMMLYLIPAKNASGVVGMYDTVSGTFFTNAGSGTFVAGPEI